MRDTWARAAVGQSQDALLSSWLGVLFWPSAVPKSPESGPQESMNLRALRFHIRRTCLPILAWSIRLIILILSTTFVLSCASTPRADYSVTMSKPSSNKVRNPSLSQKKKSGGSRNAAKTGGQVKTRSPNPRRTASIPRRCNNRTYSDKELGLPTLNTVHPIEIAKVRRSRGSKVFVDDAAKMRTILAMVNADCEAHIESKLQKARQMEVLRESRRELGTTERSSSNRRTQGA
jgi:60S ribosomal subunit assembly/export protein LOC1